MAEDEIKIEKQDKMINIVGSNLDFNRRNQVGHELNILTPDQMFSKLPNTLA